MGFWHTLLTHRKDTAPQDGPSGDSRDPAAVSSEEQLYQNQLQAMRQEVAQIPKRLAALSQQEKFMTALAAPYRTLYLEIAYGGFAALNQGMPYFWIDWQGSRPHHDLRFPLAQFTFGRPGLLPQGHRARLAEVLRRDFAATDRTSVYQAAAPLAMYFGQGLDLYLSEEARSKKREWVRLGRPELPDAWAVFYLCALAHLLTAAGDAGYVEREALLTSFAEGARYVQRHVSGWEAYGKLLLAGEEALGGNHRRGRRVLAETVQRLNECPASPWKMVPFLSGLPEQPRQGGR